MVDPRDDALLADYARFGGVTCVEDLVLIARLLMDQPVSFVARQLVDRHILSFDCRSRLFAPRFQFGTDPLRVSEPVRQAIAELQSVREGNALASWFVEPNGWLGQRRPCMVLSRHPDWVLEAARSDRRIACGW